MSIINSIKNKYKKNILYLIRDCRTDNEFHQVVGLTRKQLKVGDFIDIRIDLEDNNKEWVLCKVIGINANVFSLIIVKEI